MNLNQQNAIVVKDIMKSHTFLIPEISIFVKSGMLFGITDFVSAIKGIVL